MMKMLGRAFLLVIAGLLWNGLAHAEGNCPPGQYPVGGQGWQGCNPIPGYGNQQQAPQRPAEVWQDRYGAIAGDDKNGILGLATDMRAEGVAKDAAMVDCNAKGGVDCKVKIAFRNACAAFSTGDRQYTVVARPRLEDAVSAGIKGCVDTGDRNCRTALKVCSPPVRVQ
ncbi:DUF4189 domain-containing protein [Variovorax paradoxus]|uniref:DUF4189 domain-containing protein n=1 Tax=Variovorax paradoxus TaxID=34073 RepID=UPI002787897A|nr:DUF4189 domain-containing protein [Variovorax paradoxus]MDP9930071.1 hypothetical protein [Variovorax paradoxus]